MFLEGVVLGPLIFIVGFLGFVYFNRFRVYTGYDVYDEEKSNPVQISMRRSLGVGSEFEIDDVVYKVLEYDKKKNEIITKMIKYKLRNSVKQFIHKCPAKKAASVSLSRDDVIRLEDKYGEKRARAILSERVSKTIRTEITCEYCGCLFWKEEDEPAKNLYVDKVLDKEEDEDESN